MRKVCILCVCVVCLLTGCNNRFSIPNGGTENGGKAESSPGLSEPPSSETIATGTVQHPAVTRPPSSGDVIEIKEKMFIAQTNDIYLNPQDYLGKTISYEGLFKSSYWEPDDITYYFVIRYGPGCCGFDGDAGFEVVWNGDWPEENAWCSVTGVLEQYEDSGFQSLRLLLTSLTVKEDRGAEYVFQ